MAFESEAGGDQSGSLARSVGSCDQRQTESASRPSVPQPDDAGRDEDRDEVPGASDGRDVRWL